jgi:hypothetical protein
MNEVLPKFEQDPAETLDYSVEFGGHCARVREAGTDYVTGTRIRPAKDTGYQFNASTGGHTATVEPRWPTSGTVADGSVIWTAEAISTASLRRTLSSAAWAADTGITVGTQSTVGTKATALISGGTLGQTYLIRCTGTCSDGTLATGAFYVEFKRPARVVNA